MDLSWLFFNKEVDITEECLTCKGEGKVVTGKRKTNKRERLTASVATITLLYAVSYFFPRIQIGLVAKGEEIVVAIILVVFFFLWLMGGRK